VRRDLLEGCLKPIRQAYKIDFRQCHMWVLLGYVEGVHRHTHILTFGHNT
jgi:hypothetical protein